MRSNRTSAIQRLGAGSVLLLLTGVFLSVCGEQRTSSAQRQTNASAMPQEDNRFCVRVLESARALNDGPAVEVRVWSPRPFPVLGMLPELRIGSQRFTLSRYPSAGDAHTLVFTLTPEEFAGLEDGETVVVQYGAGRAPAERTWEFGPLDKTRTCTG